MNADERGFFFLSVQHMRCSAPVSVNLRPKISWFSSDWWGRNRQLTLFDQDL